MELFIQRLLNRVCTDESLAEKIANIPTLRDVLMIKRNFIVIDAEIWYNNTILLYAEVKLVSVSYSKLWKVLIDKKMSKADLRKAAGLAPNTMTKLRRDEEVKLSILCRICAVLHVNFGDIIDFVPSDAEKENRDIIVEQSEA